MRHELGHDMIAKGEVDINKVRERIKQILQTDEGIDEAAKHYEEAYSGSGYTADEIAISRDDKVFIVDSSIENGKIEMGVREILDFADEKTRDEYTRRQNNDAVSKGRVSDGLSSKLKREDDNNRRRDLRRESGAELSVDQGKSEDQQSGVFSEDADQRGLTEYKSPEEAKISGEVSDAKFSIEFADDIANKQRKYEADGLSMISSAELEQAISDTARMVDEMKPYANILPQDKDIL